MKLGVIGFGEAGYEMSIGLKGEGLDSVVAYDSFYNHPVYGEVIKRRAMNSNIELKDSPQKVLNDVEAVIVAVPGTKAIEVSETIGPFLKEGTLYIDVSASTPKVKQSIWQNIENKKVLFVDAAMLGPLPIYKHKVPILASGNGTDQFLRLFSPYGMDISKVSDYPGEASAIKLIRSIFMKGMAALLIEALQAAEVFKVEDLVLKSLSETMDGRTFEQTMNRLVTGSAIHAERRIHEMEGVVELLESSNIPPTMSAATKERLQWLVNKNLKEKFKGVLPKTWQEVVYAWVEGK